MTDITRVFNPETRVMTNVQRRYTGQEYDADATVLHFEYTIDFLKVPEENVTWTPYIIFDVPDDDGNPQVYSFDGYSFVLGWDITSRVTKSRRIEYQLWFVKQETSVDPDTGVETIESTDYLLSEIDSVVLKPSIPEKQKQRTIIDPEDLNVPPNPPAFVPSVEPSIVGWIELWKRIGVVVPEEGVDLAGVDAEGHITLTLKTYNGERDTVVTFAAPALVDGKIPVGFLPTGNTPGTIPLIASEISDGRSLVYSQALGGFVDGSTVTPSADKTWAELQAMEATYVPDPESEHYIIEGTVYNCTTAGRYDGVEYAPGTNWVWEVVKEGGVVVSGHWEPLTAGVELITSWGTSDANATDYVAASSLLTKRTINGVAQNLDAHVNDTDNPHSVTKAQVGLGDVVNAPMDSAPTADSANYVTSGGAYTAIAAVQSDVDAHEARTDNPHTVTKAQVGLGSVVNAPMDASPTDDSANYVSSGGVYDAIGVVQGDIDAHEARTDNPHGVTKAQVGLGNCDNTSDADKPVSTATQTALNAKLDIVGTTGTDRAYGVDGSDGSQVMFGISSDAEGYTLAYRGANGVITVGAPTADAHAATKKYVDDGLALKQDNMTAGVDYVAHNPAASRVYGTDSNGADTVIPYAETATGSTVPLRQSNGQLTVASTPVADTDAASKAFVNSSIGTNTANFLGTYPALEDAQNPSSLGFTQAQVDAMKDPYSVASEALTTALASKLAELGVTVSNNDYVFIEMDYTDPATSPDEYRRYKFNGTSWDYEYTLNNSSFTQAQWDAINSGIDTADVTAYDAHLANTSNPHAVTKAQVGLGNVDNYGSVSAWQGTPDNTHIPTEKLVKDSLDAKMDDTQLVTSWTTVTSDASIPSEKLVKDSLDDKVAGPSSSTADHILTFSDATGKVAKDSGYTIATSVPSGALFTDEKVKQSLTSNDLSLPILLSYGTTVNTSSNITQSCFRNNSIYANPSTGTVYATTFNGALDWSNVTNKPTIDATPTDGSTNAVQSDGVYDALVGKLDDSQLVTSWSGTVSDTNIPSEKLTKDTLDAKLDDSQLVTSWSGTVSDSNIPSEKLTKDTLDTKLDKVTTSGQNRAYGVSITGEQTMLNVIESAVQGSIPWRTLNGRLLVGTPTGDSDATTKKYVDDADASKLDDSQLVTSWSGTVSDTNIPSEKLVKDALDGKQAALTFDSVPTDGSANPVTSDGIFDALELAKVNNVKVLYSAGSTVSFTANQTQTLGYHTIQNPLAGHTYIGLVHSDTVEVKLQDARTDLVAGSPYANAVVATNLKAEAVSSYVGETILEIDRGDTSAPYFRGFACNSSSVLDILASLKLDASQLVTSWSGTVSDSNIPSEKLVKDSLDAKMDDSQLVTSWSGTVSDTNIPSEKLTKDSLDGKQPTLVSGTNIKTVNGSSLLGSGDLEIGGGEAWAISDITDTYPTFTRGGVTKTTAQFGEYVYANYTDKVIYVTYSQFTDPDDADAIIFSLDYVRMREEDEVPAYQARFVQSVSSLPFYYYFTLTGGTSYLGTVSLQTQLTFDSAPTANSTNPVTSGGVKTALDGKLDKVTTTEGNKFYAVDSSGQKMYYGTTGATTGMSTVALRNSDGNISVATPTANAHAATKAYVDALAPSFVAHTITNASSGTVSITTGRPWMAQLIDSNGKVVTAEVTIGADSVSFATNAAISGELRVLVAPPLPQARTMMI